MKSIRISDKSYARLREVANSGHHKLIAAFDLIIDAYWEGMHDEEDGRVEKKSLSSGDKKQ
jgi:hypothetical protein